MQVPATHWAVELNDYRGQMLGIWQSRTRRTRSRYVASRVLGPFHNGMYLLRDRGR
jgi:hypothetical protein